METKDEDEVAPAVQGGPGIHVVLPGYMCPKDMGLLDYNTTDGRCCAYLCRPTAIVMTLITPMLFLKYQHCGCWLVLLQVFVLTAVARIYSGWHH